MTNKSSSKQHGLHTANQTRPKSKLRKRANKIKARARREKNPLVRLSTMSHTTKSVKVAKETTEKTQTETVKTP